MRWIRYRPWATRTSAYVIVSNPVHDDTDFMGNSPWGGGSAIVRPDGPIQASRTHEEDVPIVQEIDSGSSYQADASAEHATVRKQRNLLMLRYAKYGAVVNAANPSGLPNPSSPAHGVSMIVSRQGGHEQASPVGIEYYLPYQTSVVKSTDGAETMICATRRNDLDLDRHHRNRSRESRPQRGWLDWITIGAVSRPRKTITYRFSISSSGRLWPFLNREILNVGPLRLRFCSIDHDQIQPKSERIIRQLIVLHNLTAGPTNQ